MVGSEAVMNQPLPAPAPAIGPGTTIYKYRLISLIGQGQFGQVWLAHDLALGCEYAIKILKPGVPIDLRLREAQIGHRLRHNNLVHVHQADVVPSGSDHVVIIAMDYLPEGSIIRRVNPANFLPLPDVLRIAKDILQGLDYLHANSFYHNDIKPENVLIGGVGQAMLSDYGIMGISSNGQPVPAPGSYKLHKAPEVVSGGNISVTTDIYQVGLTLFRLATGLSTLKAKHSVLGWDNYYVTATAGKLVGKNDFPPFVPAALRRIILQATAAAPEDRFQTALEMRRAVERLSFPGHWTVDASGQLVGQAGHHRYRIERTANSNNRFAIVALKQNLNSGNETRISDFCGRDLSAREADGLTEKLIKQVVQGS
jgi:serine/threonine protein kinase